MDSERSHLRRALRRVGGRLDEVTDVSGVFRAPSLAPVGDRVYGVLDADDAKIAVGFDAKRVRLPTVNNCAMTLSGKVWVDDRTGALTIMVRYYRLAAEVSCD